MKAAKVNLVIIILITLFMGVMLALSARPASDIALTGFVMALLNCGVPANLIMDKFLELGKVLK